MGENNNDRAYLEGKIWALFVACSHLVNKLNDLDRDEFLRKIENLEPSTTTEAKYGPSFRQGFDEMVREFSQEKY